MAHAHGRGLAPTDERHQDGLFGLVGFRFYVLCLFVVGIDFIIIIFLVVIVFVLFLLA